MRARWKVLLSLALVLPLAAFLVGSLVASAADAPAKRDTIIIRDPEPVASTTAPDPSTTPASPAAPQSSRTAGNGDRGDDLGDDRGDDGVEDVRPETDDLRSSESPPTPDRTDDRGGRDDDDQSGRG